MSRLLCRNVLKANCIVYEIDIESDVQNTEIELPAGFIKLIEYYIIHSIDYINYYIIYI